MQAHALPGLRRQFNRYPKICANRSVPAVAVHLWEHVPLPNGGGQASSPDAYSRARATTDYLWAVFVELITPDSRSLSTNVVGRFEMPIFAPKALPKVEGHMPDSQTSLRILDHAAADYECPGRILGVRCATALSMWLRQFHRPVRGRQIFQMLSSRSCPVRFPFLLSSLFVLSQGLGTALPPPRYEGRCILHPCLRIRCRQE